MKQTIQDFIQDTNSVKMPLNLELFPDKQLHSRLKPPVSFLATWTLERGGREVDGEEEEHNLGAVTKLGALSISCLFSSKV